MNKKQQQKYLEKNALSVDEFAKDFTPEQSRIVQEELAYYNVLKSLRQTRKRLALTQQELADKAKLPRTTISKVESGRYNPTVATLNSIAVAMGKTLKLELV